MHLSLGVKLGFSVLGKESCIPHTGVVHEIIKSVLCWKFMQSGFKFEAGKRRKSAGVASSSGSAHCLATQAFNFFYYSSAAESLFKVRQKKCSTPDLAKRLAAFYLSLRLPPVIKAILFLHGTLVDWNVHRLFALYIVEN